MPKVRDFVAGNPPEDTDHLGLDRPASGVVRVTLLQFRTWLAGFFEALGAASAAVAAHEAAGDPHTQYLTTAEADAAYANIVHNHDLVYSAIGHNHDHGALIGLADDDHAQYHTDARALTWLGTRTTADLPEGANLYFTNERVDDRVAALLVAGTNITLTYNDAAGTLTIDAAAGGGGGGPTKISGNTGAFAADTTWLTLTANSADITSTTQTTVMTLTGLGTGTYRVKAALVFQAAATTTGIGITLNHTGTVSRYVCNWMHVTTGGAAATGVSDQATAVQAGQLMEGKAERVKDTRSSFTIGVDTANADQLAVLDAVIIVTASGDLQLKIATEIAGSAVRLMAGSTLEVHKTV